METTKVEPKKPTPQQFADAYKKLCDEMGYRIVTTPVWIARDDNTFSLVVNTSVGELPKEK